MTVLCVTTEELMATFRDLTAEEARLIEALCATAADGNRLENLIIAHCPRTAAYARACHNDPYQSSMWRRSLIFEALNEIVRGCGVEPIGLADRDFDEPPPYEYINVGDEYTPTLIFSRASHEARIFLGCVNELVERERGDRR